MHPELTMARFTLPVCLVTAWVWTTSAALTSQESLPKAGALARESTSTVDHHVHSGAASGNGAPITPTVRHLFYHYPPVGIQFPVYPPTSFSLYNSVPNHAHHQAHLAVPSPLMASASSNHVDQVVAMNQHDFPFPMHHMAPPLPHPFPLAPQPLELLDEIINYRLLSNQPTTISIKLGGTPNDKPRYHRPKPIWSQSSLLPYYEAESYDRRKGMKPRVVYKKKYDLARYKLKTKAKVYRDDPSSPKWTESDDDYATQFDDAGEPSINFARKPRYSSYEDDDFGGADDLMGTDFDEDRRRRRRVS